MNRVYEKLSDEMIHVYYPLQVSADSEMYDEEPVEFTWNNECVLRQSGVRSTPKTEYKYVSEDSGFKKKMTANGEVLYTEAMRRVPGRELYCVDLEFDIGESELLLGLGQYEDGTFDHRNLTQYLYESNMRIAIPFLVTTGHYAILIDSESCMVFKSEGNKVHFIIDSAESFSYYVFLSCSVLFSSLFSCSIFRSLL